MRRWAVASAGVVSSAMILAGCGLDTDKLINDFNDQFEDEGEIYYDPNCLDSDGDGWCD